MSTAYILALASALVLVQATTRSVVVIILGVKTVMC